MAGYNTIEYLQHQQIDKKRWDACVEQAPNGLIYGMSVYLDHMTDHWDGLILNNYEAVMPLPWRKKYGIYYLYQPFLTAQLGLFGNDVNAQMLAKFLDAIPQKFRYWDMMLNHGNIFQLQDYTLYQRVNYILDLKPGYEAILSSFRDNIRRNIKKSEQYGCYFVKDVEVLSIIDLAKEHLEDQTETDYNNFHRLYTFLNKEGKAKSFGILSRQNELLASCVFLFFKNRAYYILVGNHPNGRTLGASHALINGFIKEYAGQNLILDFEGSDIRNLAFFYNSFGAAEERYAAIKQNRLPKILKWMKA